MQENQQAKENILGRIRQQLENEQLPKPFPEVAPTAPGQVFSHTALSAEEIFAENFNALGGKFVFCENDQELMENIIALYENREWRQVLCAHKSLYDSFRQNNLNLLQSADHMDEAAEACITGCELLVARTGSILFSSMQHLGRTTPVFYPVHIVIAYANQVVYDIQDGLTGLKQKYGTNLPSMINLNTGASRTADIEKTLVVGVHGPGEVFCFYVNHQNDKN